MYLLGAVVLASLLPLFVQLFGGAASHGVERLRRLAFAGIDVEHLEPREMAVVSLAEDEPEQELVEVEVVEPVVEPEPTPRSARPRASVADRAMAACARKDKTSARTAYKSLERGDPRRKEIRRSCRASGVWFL